MPTDTRAASKRFVSSRLVASVENGRAVSSVLLSARHTGTPPEGSGTHDNKRLKETSVTSTPSRWHRRKAALLSTVALSAVTAALVTSGPAAAAYTPWTSSSVVGPGTAFRDAAGRRRGTNPSRISPGSPKTAPCSRRPTIRASAGSRTRSLRREVRIPTPTSPLCQVAEGPVSAWASTCSGSGHRGQSSNRRVDPHRPRPEPLLPRRLHDQRAGQPRHRLRPDPTR